jgi:hypothetical protein
VRQALTTWREGFVTRKVRVHLPQRLRGWLYRVGTAVVPLLVAYGVVADSKAALWVGLLGAALGGGELAIAAAHTPTEKTD